MSKITKTDAEIEHEKPFNQMEYRQLRAIESLEDVASVLIGRLSKILTISEMPTRSLDDVLGGGDGLSNKSDHNGQGSVGQSNQLFGYLR